MTLRRVLLIALAFAAIAYVVWVVPLGELARAFAAAKPGWVVSLLVVYLFGTLAWAERWRALLRPANVSISLGEAWRFTIEAQAGGVLLPGGIGGDALRIAYAQKSAPGAEIAKTIASVGVDRMIGLFTMAAMALVASLAVGVGRLGSLVYAIALIPILVLAFWAVARNRSIARSSIVNRGIFKKSVAPILAYTSDERSGKALGRAILMSALVSLVQLSVTRGLVYACGAEPEGEAWIYVGTTIAMIVAAVPGIPGGWGTADATYVVLFGRGGISASVALAVCILYRSFWYFSACLGALSALLRARNPSFPPS